jgi:hypothetical protein
VDGRPAAPREHCRYGLDSSVLRPRRGRGGAGKVVEVVWDYQEAWLVVVRSEHRSSSGDFEDGSCVSLRWVPGCAGLRRGSSGLNSRPAPLPSARMNVPAITAQYDAGLGSRAWQGSGRWTAGPRAVAVRRDARSEATTRVPR